MDLAEAVVEQDKSQIVALIVENASCEPARLKKRRVLGQLSPVTMAIATDGEETTNHGHSNRWGRDYEPDNLTFTLVMHNEVTPTPVERTQDLQLESETMSEEKKEKWRVFLTKCIHQFALNKNEFGSTNVITHSIDAGDHPPT